MLCWDGGARRVRDGRYLVAPGPAPRRPVSTRAGGAGRAATSGGRAHRGRKRQPTALDAADVAACGRLPPRAASRPATCRHAAARAPGPGATPLPGSSGCARGRPVRQLVGRLAASEHLGPEGVGASAPAAAGPHVRSRSLASRRPPARGWLPSFLTGGSRAEETSVSQETPTHDPDLRTADPEVADLVQAEAERQHDTLRLIASENYVSAAVLEATGTVLTNKYSEGYAGKRYYEGQQVIDQVETLADRAGQGAVRGRARQRPALLRLARQPRRLPGLPEARRHRDGHGPADGRAPHPRLDASRPPASGSAPVQYGVRRDTGRVDMDEVRDLALRRAAQDDLLRRHRDPAHDRLPGLRRDRPRGRRGARRRHRAHRRPGRGRRAPVAGRATPTSSRPPPTRPCAARAARC